MNSDSFVVIQGWMCNELNLKGNELLIYALIYGFSQDAKSIFCGGRQYIADTFNISLPTVDKALQSLIDKNYITKQSSNDYIHTDRYQVNVGVVKKLYEGSKETLLNNIDNNKTNINNISKDILLQNSEDDVSDKLYSEDKPKKKKSLYDKCVDEIFTRTEDLELQDLLVTYLNMRLEVKDKPLYFNMWKGMLNKLFDMSYNLDILCKVVQQSIDKGWLAFYEISDASKKKNVQLISSEYNTVTCDKADYEEFIRDVRF